MPFLTSMATFEESSRLQQVDPVVTAIGQIFRDNADKRICVVGTTCSGKSTLVAKFPGSRDQDAEVFPKLSAEESRYVSQQPWTPEIGQTMIRLVRERVQTEPGKPLFGTVLVDCDLVVVLRVSDRLLAQRCESRGVKLSDARAMQEQLFAEVGASGIRSIEVPIVS